MDRYRDVHQPRRKLLRRTEEAVMKLTSPGCRHIPLELVEDEALEASGTPAAPVGEDRGTKNSPDRWQ